MNVTVTRKAHFNAAHRLYHPDWDDAKNAEVFGKCSNPNYHGHNYVLLVSLTGKIDPVTGFVYDLGKLSRLIEEKIEKRFDHKNLNLDTAEFAGLNPTAENIAVVIWQILRRSIEKEYALCVELFETERNIVKYCGE